MRIKQILFFSLIALMSVVLIACGSGESDDSSNGGSNEKKTTTNLTLGTASSSGVYYALGGEIANILNANVDVDGLSVSSVESGASVENIAKIDSKDFQLGMAQNNTAFNAVNGIEEFDGKEISSFGVITSLHPEALHIITLESTGIESVADLAGKKVAIGVPSSATNQASRTVLESYGINDGDYTAYEEDLDDAKDKLQNGTIDAVLYNVGIPSSALSELHAATGEVKLLGLNDDAITAFTDSTPYVEYTIREEFYEWLDEPVQTIAALALLIGSVDEIDEDLGYEITKTIIEKADDITISQKAFINEEEALDGAQDLPLHPGAEKYYREIGIIE